MQLILMAMVIWMWMSLSASNYDDKIAWYENTDGQGTFSTQKTITTQADGAWSVYAADIDGIHGQLRLIGNTLVSSIIIIIIFIIRLRG